VAEVVTGLRVGLDGVAAGALMDEPACPLAAADVSTSMLNGAKWVLVWRFASVAFAAVNQSRSELN